jgi:hypothetical protein
MLLRLEVSMLKSRLVLAAVASFLLVGCGSYYSTVRQTPMAGNLKAYPMLAVGWLDLGEQKYQTYGYSEQDKDKWFKVISDSNLQSLPQFLKEHLPNKTIHVAKSKTEPLPVDGLVVLFADVNYNQQTSSAAQVMFGAMAGSDTLDLTVRFIDGRSGQELYSETVSLTSQAGTGWSSMGFEGRVTNAVYNLARFIAEKVK